MKKWKCFLGIIVCWMFCGFLVNADIIYEPPDYFYETHSSKCEYLNRAFTANGPDDVVYIYKSPESPQIMETLKNGTIVRIYYTYQDSSAISWGICDDGWVPMEYMEVVYDSISFAEEYAADIANQDGVLDEQYMGQTVYLWTYPGASSCAEILAEGHMPQYNKKYIDKEGRSWGNIGYYYGIRNRWVCLDFPTQDFDALFPDGAPQAGSTIKEESMQSAETEQESKRIVPKPNHGMVILTTVIVLGVILVTMILLVLMKQSRKKL